MPGGKQPPSLQCVNPGGWSGRGWVSGNDPFLDGSQVSLACPLQLGPRGAMHTSPTVCD